ncbi:hypothetical protein [Novosphingobium sp. PC22D]|uniref:hypothetical protein n=1 Tax=Novosphingobium sp. PC22D TaxID=1962403 RepID=UPI0011451CE8
MNDPLALPWLLPPPDGFRQVAKALRLAEDCSPDEVGALSRFALDLSQLGQLGKVVERHRESLSQSSRFRALRLGVVATHTSDLVAEALAPTSLRHGLLVECERADYGQAAQELLDPSSRIAAFKPDFVLLALDIHALGLSRPVLDEQDAERAVENAVDYVAMLRDGCHANLGAGAVLHTLAPPPESLFGNFDACHPGTVASLVATFNRCLVTELVRDGDLLVDIARIANTVGLARWHDPLRWHDAKMPFALDAIPLYADHVCRVLAAARGLARKCLVLDLDNTLWGGVIGDDGLEGIALGQGSASGEAHLAIQPRLR